MCLWLLLRLWLAVAVVTAAVAVAAAAAVAFFFLLRQRFLYTLDGNYFLTVFKISFFNNFQTLLLSNDHSHLPGAIATCLGPQPPVGSHNQQVDSFRPANKGAAGAQLPATF